MNRLGTFPFSWAIELSCLLPAVAATWSLGSRLLILGLLLAVPLDRAASGEPYLVRDINPGTVPGVEHVLASLTAADESLFFTYDDGIHGRELWTSDRTTAGTRLVADIHPGSEGSRPWNLIAEGGTLYFQALDGDAHEAIWASDGAPEGTALFAAMPEESDVVLLAALNGRVFFSASGALWASDGSAEGPQRLAENLVAFGRTRFLVPSVFDGVPVVIDDRVYFTADSVESGVELWSSDGTPEGTRLVMDIAAGPESSHPRGLTVSGQRVFFLVGNGSELWISEGADDARFVKTLEGGGSGLQAAGERVFFTAGFDSEIWVSDGAEEGTFLVGRIGEIEHLVTAGDVAYFDDEDEAGLWVTDGTPDRIVRFDGVEPLLPASGDAKTLGDTLFFFGLSDGRRELWVASGLSAFPLSPAEPPFGFHTREFVRAGDRVFVSSMATLLWVTDGTRVGSSIIRAELPGAPQQLTVVGENDLNFTIGRQLWFSDGSGEGTMLVKELEPSPPVPASSNPSGLIAAGERVFFGVSRFADEPGLWASDGTEEGTTFVHDTAALATGRAEVVNGHLFFWSGSTRVGELWMSDGMPESTRRIGDTWIAVLNDRAFFGAEGGLWVSDGTPDGTRIVKELGPWPETPPLDNLTVAGEQIFFIVADPLRSMSQLWVSDGEREGTRLVSELPFIIDELVMGAERVFILAREEIWISNGTTDGTRFVKARPPGGRLNAVVGDKLFFTAWISGDTAEMWLSDGTGPGTRSVASFGGNDDCTFDGEDCPDISNLVPAFDRVYYQVVNQSLNGGDRLNDSLWVSFEDGQSRRFHGSGNLSSAVAFGSRIIFSSGGVYWVSDGTPEGTQSLGVTSRSAVVALETERVFFASEDDEHGQELWVSDGTPEGTRLLKDIRPGPGGSKPSGLRAQGDLVYFAADDGATGEEPWVSDGTAGGTRRLVEVVAGPGGSAPSEFTLAGERLFFAADDGVHGSELWALPIEARPRFRRGDCDGDGRVAGQVTDAVFLLSYNFLGGTEPPCLAACDANGDGQVDGQVTDAVYLLTWNFLEGPAPIAPFPVCGEGPLDTDETLECETSAESCR